MDCFARTHIQAYTHRFACLRTYIMCGVIHDLYVQIAGDDRRGYLNSREIKKKKYNFDILSNQQHMYNAIK